MSFVEMEKSDVRINHFSLLIFDVSKILLFSLSRKLSGVCMMQL